MTAPRRRATYDDVLAAAPNLVAEIVDGVLYTTPRPAMPHAAASGALHAEIALPFGRGRGGPGGWIIVFEPELHFADDILVPDIAGWRRERLPAFTNDEPFVRLAPDWLCEVLSPSTSKLDRVAKLPVYAREGVRHVWLVDPLLRTLEVLRLEGASWLLIGAWRDDAVVRVEPFDAIELDLANLWADVTLEKASGAR